MLKLYKGKEFMKKIKYIILIVISLFIIVFFNNNYFLYDDSILKITKIENIYYEETESYTQELTGIIKNGEYKDEIFTVNNETSISSVYDETLNVGDNIFVKINSNNESISSILGVKRDAQLIILLVLFIDLILIITGLTGIKTLISLAINIFLSVALLIFYIASNYSFNLLLMFILLSILFIMFSLIIPHGINKKSLSAISSTFISLIISFTLSYTLINIFGDELYYYTMDYVDVVSDYKSVFYVIVLLSGLGAIMDIAITMSSSINELILKNKNITTKDLTTSGKIISEDIIGTMINVLLYTSFVSTIPTLVLVVKNNMTLFNAIDIYGQIQIVIILTSVLSVILAVPISLYTSLYFFRRKND